LKPPSCRLLLPSNSVPSRPLRVGLLWHSLASGNLGVDALTAASLAILTDEAAAAGLSVEPVVIGMDDSSRGPARRSDLTFFPVRRNTLLTSGAYWRLVGDLDCVIDIGAGDSFADIYGFKRFGFLWLSKAMALARGTPLLLAPQTVGPFANGLARKLAAAVLARCNQVVTRDHPSLDLVQTIAPTARVEQGVDVAFELPFTDRSAERNGARVRIGVNVSGLLADQATSGTNRFGLSYDYFAAMVELVGRLAANPKHDVFVFTHVSGNADATDDDGWAADAAVAQAPAAQRVPDFADASAAKSFVSSLDFVVAARMHACVAALSSGVPVAPVAYSRKFAGLFGGIGYDVEIPVRGLDTAGAVEAILTLVDQRADLQVKVDAARATAAQRTVIYRAALRRLLIEVSAGQ
jgi:colanic acid/amylovoran biosynthesis protein